MLNFYSTRWRIKLRARRKKNRVKQMCRLKVMHVFVKRIGAGKCSICCKSICPESYRKLR
ncbi:hypothetical protein HanIR_Chr15g0762911 [Helianthus annuus]|nr:hypothetical protein HanIR_Chr15g0762911 [Helianthus annuus]